MKIKIKDGFIVDGTGKKGFLGDILINGEKIEEVGVVTQEVDRVIEAKGLVVAPALLILTATVIWRCLSALSCFQSFGRE